MMKCSVLSNLVIQVKLYCTFSFTFSFFWPLSFLYKALLCSCFVPVYSGVIPPQYKGEVSKSVCTMCSVTTCLKNYRNTLNQHTAQNKLYIQCLCTLPALYGWRFHKHPALRGFLSHPHHLPVCWTHGHLSIRYLHHPVWCHHPAALLPVLCHQLHQGGRCLVPSRLEGEFCNCVL